MQIIFLQLLLKKWDLSRNLLHPLSDTKYSSLDISLTFSFYLSSVHFCVFQFPLQMHTKSAVYSLAVSQFTGVNEVSKNVLLYNARYIFVQDFL